LTEVRARDGEAIEGMLRRFKKKVQEDGMIAELKRREHYDKPSIKKKKKSIAARKKMSKRSRY
jgi:small subunit ribosomal protein S21